MSEDIPEYSHVTLLNGLGAVVVRVHSHHPLFDFFVARDHGSDIIEVASSIAGAAKGEVGVCFNKKDLTPVSVLDRNGWRPSIPGDEGAVSAARSRYAVARNLLALLTED
jgi:hypothetical protein